VKVESQPLILGLLSQPKINVITPLSEMTFFVGNEVLNGIPFEVFVLKLNLSFNLLNAVQSDIKTDQLLPDWEFQIVFWRLIRANSNFSSGDVNQALTVASSDWDFRWLYRDHKPGNAFFPFFPHLKKIPELFDNGQFECRKLNNQEVHS
jgi:hypothetical protein